MTSVILIQKYQLRLSASFSLKDKRKIRQSLFTKLKQRYNIALLETQDLDKWQSLCFEIAYLCLKEQEAKDMAYKLADFITSQTASFAEILSLDNEII